MPRRSLVAHSPDEAINRVAATMKHDPQGLAVAKFAVNDSFVNRGSVVRSAYESGHDDSTPARCLLKRSLSQRVPATASMPNVTQRRGLLQ